MYRCILTFESEYKRILRKMYFLRYWALCCPKKYNMNKIIIVVENETLMILEN